VGDPLIKAVFLIYFVCLMTILFCKKEVSLTILAISLVAYLAVIFGFMQDII